MFRAAAFIVEARTEQRVIAVDCCYATLLGLCQGAGGVSWKKFQNDNYVAFIVWSSSPCMTSSWLPDATKQTRRVTGVQKNARPFEIDLGDGFPLRIFNDRIYKSVRVNCLRKSFSPISPQYHYASS